MATTALTFHGAPALTAPIAASSIRVWLKGLVATAATVAHQPAHQAGHATNTVDLAMEQAKLDGQAKARFWL